jgi:hypothetical protein
MNSRMNFNGIMMDEYGGPNIAAVLLEETRRSYGIRVIYSSTLSRERSSNRRTDHVYEFAGKSKNPLAQSRS